MRFDILKFGEIVGDITGGRVVLIESVGDIGLRIALGFLKNASKEGYRVFAIVPKRLEEDLKKELSSAKIITPNDDFTLHELFTISLAVKKLEEKVGLIDILQTLLIIHPPEKVYQLFQEICDIVREKKGILIVTVDKKLADERVLAMLESEADYVIEIEEIIEGLRIRRGIRVKKNPNKPPSKFCELIINGNIIRLGERID
jgi:archaellum biogenesis ATPase FlaH